MSIQILAHKKDRSKFRSILRHTVESHCIDPNLSVLVVGGSTDDLEALSAAGFRKITLSTFGAAPTTSSDAPEAPTIYDMDVEAMRIEDEVFDITFAHEVLHHCRSPHRALCEMMRVSRCLVMFLEPNDSFLMRALVRSGLSFPFELAAVMHHGGKSGGVRDTGIPNFIYRWNKSDVLKTVCSFLPEREVGVNCAPYWDFNVDEYELSLRTNTRIGVLTSILGTGNFLKLIRLLSRVLNGVSILRGQGNKHFCLIKKQAKLRPWLRQMKQEVVFVGGAARIADSVPGEGTSSAVVFIGHGS